MCYAKPGPRCSGHAYQALTEARADYDARPSEAAWEDVKKHHSNSLGLQKDSA